MDIPETLKQPIKDFWEVNDARQGAKAVISHAVANVSDISVKELEEIFAELDRLLLAEKEEETNQKNRGL